MLNRKIINELAKWKKNPSKKCLVLQGARQIGKTHAVRIFADKNYKKMYELNFVKNESYKEIFAGDLDKDSILKRMSLTIPNFSIVPGETLIFLDEIQECPNARTAIKFIVGDPSFDVIASGSMLGIHYKEVKSFPVGFVENVNMYSMDFEEFLWAEGISETAIAELKGFYERKERIPEGIHQRMMELFREYIVVGGMPEAVQKFVNTHNFAEVLRIQKDILSGYEDDIVKYASSAEKTKARSCFLSIPRHLSLDYKKFRYSIVKSKGTSSMFEGSLMWLYDAGIINFCHNLSAMELPLKANSIDNEFKVYMRDTGLLVAMLEDGAQRDIMTGNLGIYKGAIYENIIAEIFAKNGRELYYYQKDGHLEIDFLIRHEGELTAVEVKSADNTKSKSMNSAFDNYGVPCGIKLSSKNLSVVWALKLNVQKRVC